MVKIAIRGGLGNQLFIFATGYALARQLHTELQIDFVSGYTKEISGNMPHAKCELHKFHNIMTMICNEEQPPSDIVMLEGYFQDYRHFHKFADDIKVLLQYEHDILPENMVALHVRRQDHLELGWNSPDNYYIENLAKYFSNYQPLIFTDDEEYCKRFNIPIYKSSGDAITDMLTMSTASAFIIANSTYSWWAAYLSGKTKVVYPESILRICNKNLNMEGWIGSNIV